MKDVRFGTIELRDYRNEQLEVVRQKGTGLFMVQIDQSNPYSLLYCQEIPKESLVNNWQRDVHTRRTLEIIAQDTARARLAATTIYDQLCTEESASLILAVS